MRVALRAKVILRLNFERLLSPLTGNVASRVDGRSFEGKEGFAHV